MPDRYGLRERETPAAVRKQTAKCEYSRGPKPQVSVALKDQSGTSSGRKVHYNYTIVKSFFDAKPALLLLCVPLWFHFVGT